MLLPCLHIGIHTHADPLPATNKKCHNYPSISLSPVSCKTTDTGSDQIKLSSKILTKISRAQIALRSLCKKSYLCLCMVCQQGLLLVPVTAVIAQTFKLQRYVFPPLTLLDLPSGLRPCFGLKPLGICPQFHEPKEHTTLFRRT